MSVLFEDFFLANGSPWGPLYTQAAPAITSLSATYGDTKPRTIVITGTNLNWAQSVVIGSIAATSFTVDSATQITAVFPPLTGAGSYNVVVTTAYGTSNSVVFTAIATITWATGFEGGSIGVTNTTSSALFTLASGATIVANPATRADGVGIYCCRQSPAAGTTYVQLNGGTYAPSGQSVRVVRFYVYWQVLPTSRQPFFEMGGTVNGVKLYADTTGVEARYGNAGTTQNLQAPAGTNTVFAVNTWYCIDIVCDYSVNVSRVRINAVDQISSTTGTTSFTAPGVAVQTHTYLTWGAPDPSTYTINYDDMALSGLASDYPLGTTPGSTILNPTVLDAAQASTNFGYFTGGALTALSTANQATALPTIQDAAPRTSVTDYLQQTTANAAAYVDVTFPAPPANVIGATVARLITGMTANITTAATSVTAKGVVSGVATDLYTAYNINSTAIVEMGGALTAPASGWTAAALASLHLRYGFAATVAAIGQLQHAYIEYEPIIGAAVDPQFAAFGIPL